MAGAEHRVMLNNREEMEMTGVVSVDSFDEECIILDTVCGAMVLEGEQMHITGLDLEEGKIHVIGKVSNIYYRAEGTPKTKGKNILGRLLK